MKIGLLILIGIPASGKTTLAKTLINNYQNHNKTFIRVSYDELIPVSNQIRAFEWKLARCSLSVKIEKLVACIKNRDVEGCPDEFQNQLRTIKSWDSNFVLIIDDNMYFKSMRYSLFQIARKQSVGYCQVYINCLLHSALLRNSLRREQIIPPHIIENMHEKIEPPNLKNNWEKYSVELDPYCELTDIDHKLIPVLNASLENCFSESDESEERELSQVQCKKSVVHQVDIGLRKVVGSRIRKCLSENSREGCQEYVDGLNERKCQILSDIKSGNICLPNDVVQEIEDDGGEQLNLIAFLDGYF